MGNVSQGGDLYVPKWKDGVVQGDEGDLPVNRSVNTPQVGGYPGVTFGDIDATHSMGAVGGTESDAMFAKFSAVPLTLGGGASHDSIGAENISGDQTHSAPMFENSAVDADEDSK